MMDGPMNGAPINGAAGPPLLEVQDLSVRFTGREATVNAVSGATFSLRAGEVLCLLGESGSGKSVTLRALMRLLPKRAQVAGRVSVAGQDVMALNGAALRSFRGGTVSMVFQEPMTALDPVYTIGQHLTEMISRHKGGTRAEVRARALEMLDLVKVPAAARRLDAYPHELSGGLRQRAMIAIALSCGPRLLLADEPTTALDATVQIQVLILLRRLQQELGMGTIFVTHDLGVAAEIADRVAVMYAGRVVEEGPVADVLRAPAHPYTAGLMASTVHDQAPDEDIAAIPGSPPDLRHLPPGCSFAPRCAWAMPACRQGFPDPVYPAPGRMARCLRVADVLRASPPPPGASQPGTSQPSASQSGASQPGPSQPGPSQQGVHA